jgi:hypothetical protein
VRVIGITSPSGAALRDIVRTLALRWPAVEVASSPRPRKARIGGEGDCSRYQRSERAGEAEVILIASWWRLDRRSWAFQRAHRGGGDRRI